MSREQTARSPLPPEAEAAEVPPVESAPTEGTGATLEARISALAQEAHQEFGTRREEVVGALNAMLERLPREASPDEAAAALHRLLGGGLLDDLEDAEGLPAGIAATRALMELGYPHALEVPPERLEALNRWRAPGVRDPLHGPMAGALALATMVQMSFVTTVDHGSPSMRISLETLVGMLREPTWTDRLRDFVRDGSVILFFYQLGLNVLAFVLSLAMARWRPRVRRGFFGLATFGAAVGVLQLSLGLNDGWGTLASAGGSLVAGWLLRES